MLGFKCKGIKAASSYLRVILVFGHARLTLRYRPQGFGVLSVLWPVSAPCRVKTRVRNGLSVWCPGDVLNIISPAARFGIGMWFTEPRLRRSRAKRIAVGKVRNWLSPKGTSSRIYESFSFVRKLKNPTKQNKTSFWPNSCCKLFIYVLCKRKIYVGHQVPHGTLFLARNDNWLLLTGDWNALISYILFYARARSLDFKDIKRCYSTLLEMF